MCVARLGSLLDFHKAITITWIILNWNRRLPEEVTRDVQLFASYDNDLVALEDGL